MRLKARAAPFLMLLVLTLLAGLCAPAPATPAAEVAATATPAEAKATEAPAAAAATEAPTIAPTEAPPPAEEAKPSGTLIVAIGADVTSLANTEAVDYGSHAVRHDLYNQLVNFDQSMQVVPELATEWSISEDRLTWTFKLRDDVRFHDGTPFNAEAVKFNIDRLLAPEWPDTPAKNNWKPVVANVDVVDEFTVAITTTKTFGALPSFLAGVTGDLVSQSPTAVKERGETFQFNPVGTGPYKAVEWDRGNQIVFEANLDYWGEPPQLERIVYKIIPEATARTIALETGEVDVAWQVAIEDVERLQGNPDVQVRITPSSRTAIFWINVDNPPFDDPRVRQALNYAIDRDSIREFVMKGVAAESNCTPVGPGVPGHAPGFCYEYDPDRAKALLAEAGVPEGFEFDLWGPQGRYTKDAELLEAVAGQLEAVGLKPKIRVFGDFPTYLQEALVDPDLDLAFCSILGVPYDASGYFIFFQSDLAGKPFNISRIREPRVDELLTQGAAETDPATRQTLYEELQQIVTEKAYFIVLQHEAVVTAFRKNVEGIVIRPSYELLVGAASKR